MNQHSHSCPIKYSTESPNGANDISVAEELRMSKHRPSRNRDDKLAMVSM